MKVKFIDYPATYIKDKGTYINLIDNVLSRGDLILRHDIEQFEAKIATYLGAKYAVALNSGTDALYIALKLAGIKAGDEVITVSNTFKSTIAVIEQCGAKPVLVDITEDYVMDMDEFKKAITPRTRAVIPVHLSGDVCDMAALRQVVRDSGQFIAIIEDAAQAFGAMTNTEKMAGTNGLFGCFSFYPAKILGGFGDGGALVTNKEALYKEALDFRNHYKVQGGKWGINSRLDNVWGAVLAHRLSQIGSILDRRKEIAETYDRELRDLPLVRPRHHTGRVWQDYIISVSDGKRDALASYLRSKDIEIMIPPALPHQEMKIPANLPKSEAYNATFIRLPCNENLKNEEIDYVILRIKEFFSSCR